MEGRYLLPFHSVSMQLSIGQAPAHLSRCLWVKQSITAVCKPGDMDLELKLRSVIWVHRMEGQ